MVAVALTAALAGAAPAAAGPGVTVVMSALDNPRGLTFGPQGALYVAEAGRGGYPSVDCSSTPLPVFCFLRPGFNVYRSYGPTGAISRLWHGVQKRVVSGLPSQARASDGANAIGPHDIAMLGVGNAYVTIGWQQSPTLRDTLADEQTPEWAGFARLAQVEPSGRWRFVADLGAYEAANNPDGGPLDSNPYGLLAESDGHVLTDAGGNSLLRVDANGDISTLAVFQSRGTDPPRSTDSVPTSVTIGPDGAYYVGELSGEPFAPGSANVYRVVPGGPPLVLTQDACLGNFTTIIDMAFDDEGNLYVLQFGPGTLVRVTPDRDAPGGICAQYQAGTRTTILGGLRQPTSIAVGPDGALYVSNHGGSIANPPPPAVGGEVLRIEP